MSATNCKSATADKFQTFRTIFGISCKFQIKNALLEIILFVLFWRGISYKRNHWTFQENKERNQLFERKCPVSIWLHGYIQPSSFSSALILGLITYRWPPVAPTWRRTWSQASGRTCDLGCRRPRCPPWRCETLASTCRPAFAAT